MYCDQCGAQNREQAKFCISCGAKLFDSQHITSTTEHSEQSIANNNDFHNKIGKISTNYGIEDKPKLPSHNSSLVHTLGENYDKKEQEKSEPSTYNLWEIIKSLNKTEGRITPSSSLKIIGIIILMILGVVIIASFKNEDLIRLYLLIIAIPAMYLIYASHITMLVQRLHDIGLSGYLWWLIMPIIKISSSWIVSRLLDPSDFQDLADFKMKTTGYSTLLMWLMILIIYCIPGEDLPNAYGTERK